MKNGPAHSARAAPPRPRPQLGPGPGKQRPLNPLLGRIRPDRRRGAFSAVGSDLTAVRLFRGIKTPGDAVRHQTLGHSPPFSLLVSGGNHGVEATARRSGRDGNMWIPHDLLKLENKNQLSVSKGYFKTFHISNSVYEFVFYFSKHNNPLISKHTIFYSLEDRSTKFSPMANKSYY